MQKLVEYQDWTINTAKKAIGIDFVRFGIVGSSGFIVNTIFLTLFYTIFHLPLLWSQLLAAEIALTCNFILHNLWTYKSNYISDSLFRKYILFQGSSWTGVAITTITLLILVKVFYVYYILALVVGSGITMIWNYGWTKYYIFSKS